jgi:MFS family permease
MGAKAGEHPMGVMAEGMRYAYRSMPIRSILLLLSALSLLGGVFYALVPVFAKEVFAGGPKTMGFLLSFSGIGATVGAFYLAGRRTVIGLGRIMGLASIGAGVAMITFASASHIALAALASLASGAFMILSIGSMNIVIQTLVDEDKRGRIMGLYGIALVGMSPIGSLVAGALALHVGIVATLAWAGALCTTAAVVFWLRLPRFRSIVRPIYASKGIFPQP